ncbi:hypothetical protein M413DRAFT_390577 [Hebeloma cylindrosporum]|uniref:Uncharacterized protein n=1 Tax=Hebeloma cylindrosporum TaxID=76867 RepID=A0A0C3CJE6_HEBCY|nr:hypothetical protein M413DRAFT_390577 [Hebeloma cylindrosporum h7]
MTVDCVEYRADKCTTRHRRTASLPVERDIFSPATNALVQAQGVCKLGSSYIVSVAKSVYHFTAVCFEGNLVKGRKQEKEIVQPYLVLVDCGVAALDSLRQRRQTEQ